MWRRNQLCGCCGVAFGLGLLIGCSLESGFWSCACGIVLIVLGVLFLQRKQA